MSGAVGDSWGLIILGSSLKLRVADGSSERLLVSSNFGFIFTGPTPNTLLHLHPQGGRFPAMGNIHSGRLWV